MTVVTVSPKYQVVIPKDVREHLGIQPGQKIQAIAFGDRIELVPLKHPSELRGFVKRINAEFEREPDRI